MKNNTSGFWLKRFALAALSAIALPAVAQSSGPAAPVACIDEVRTLGTSLLTKVATVPLNLPVLNFGIVDGRRFASIDVLRHACGGSQSAVIVSIDDHATWSGFPPPTMLYPEFRATQDGHVATLTAVSLASGHRIAPKSIGNIGISGLGLWSFASLEVASGEVDLNRAFVLTVVDPFNPAGFNAVSVPAFQPTPATYPNAYGPRRINGRYAGNYFDPARPGEGIIVEIGDVPGQAGKHFLQFSWFTYDNSGNPFWISGGGNFSDGDRQLQQMPAAFRGGGGFAGSNAADSLTIWGTVDMEFSDCDSLDLSYVGKRGLPSDVPTGIGRLHWKRLTAISGYSCK
ncbi:MAG: hypothetical protein ABI411_13750 [Tahibacter sp.]